MAVLSIVKLGAMAVCANFIGASAYDTSVQSKLSYGMEHRTTSTKRSTSKFCCWSNDVVLKEESHTTNLYDVAKQVGSEGTETEQVAEEEQSNLSCPFPEPIPSLSLMSLLRKGKDGVMGICANCEKHVLKSDGSMKYEEKYYHKECARPCTKCGGYVSKSDVGPCSDGRPCSDGKYYHGQCWRDHTWYDSDE